MKNSEFKKLEAKINSGDFNQSYKMINIAMTILSYFGHIASIFLAYFMLSKVLSSAMTDNPIAVFITSIILLSGLELIKRDLFDKFSVQYLKLRSFGKDVLPLFLLSLLIISISFYSSINGAKEFSNKSKALETNKKELFHHYKDSVTVIYTDKIKSVEDEIKLTKSKLETKDKEQTELESTISPSYQQRNRIKDLKSERSQLRNDISKLEGDINNVKLELNTTIKSKEDEINKEVEEKKQDNSTNSLLFVIISTFVEMVILAGVWFNEYYKFRSYNDYKNKIERDPNYQKWVIYDSILNVVYDPSNKINDKLPASKNIIDMCKLNDVIVLQKDITDFMKLANSIGIIKTSGSSRYFSKSRDISFEILKNHFNIE